MSDQTVPQKKSKAFNLSTALLLLLPLAVLGGVILLFWNTGGGLRPASPVPIEDLKIERTILRPGAIDMIVRNVGPHDLTIAQAVVNSAVWPVTVTPDPTLGRLEKATVHLDYAWSEGEAYAVTLFTTNAIPFQVGIPVAFTTPQPSARTFASFTLIGVYVGVIPVYLGLFWFPALRKLGNRWMIFLLAITAGLLIFLGLDTVAEALDQAAGIPGPFQGIGLVGIGAVATFFLLDAISRRQSGIVRSEASHRLALAYMIATGIGLHNLGEGLAIGASYNLGKVALGAFLVVGFIIQNITEGLGIIAPVLRDHPGVKKLALMGLVGGGPAILGAWIGGLSPSPVLGVLFLAVGTGAVFEVVYEIAKLIQKDTAREPKPFTVLAGVVSGMLMLWVTGLLVK